jgi:hypothetical protein
MVRPRTIIGGLVFSSVHAVLDKSEDRCDLQDPRKRETEDYIAGRFG